MNWSQEELNLIEKYRLEIDNDPERFIEKCLIDFGISGHKIQTRIIFGLCLLLNKPIFLKPNDNLEIEVSLEANGRILLVMYVELWEEIKDDFEEIQKNFFEDLLNYYEIDRDTAGRICCRLTRKVS